MQKKSGKIVIEILLCMLKLHVLPRSLHKETYKEGIFTLA